MSISKTFGALALGTMGLMTITDATAQDTKTAAKQEPPKVVKFIADTNDATLVSKSNAELAGRTTVENANSNKITKQDTPLAETVEAIAAEVAEYGLLQTRKDKLDFATKIENIEAKYIEAGSKAPFRLHEFFLNGLKWLKGNKSDKYFPENVINSGYTKERLIRSVINSPDFESAFGSLSSIPKGLTTVIDATNHNEGLIQNGKLASNKLDDNRLVKIIE